MQAERNNRKESRPYQPAVFVCITSLLLLMLAVSGWTQSPPRSQKRDEKTTNQPLPATQAEIERGSYIVNNVAMCPQCHTPRLANEQLDPRRPLDGAPEFFQPPHPDADWPLKAPRIGGDPPANDQDIIKLLMTGIWTDGKPLRLPMMPFRMNEQDARAVVAYLHSVKQVH
jgi:hypothetical protein